MAGNKGHKGGHSKTTRLISIEANPNGNREERRAAAKLGRKPAHELEWVRRDSRPSPGGGSR